jgi:hypothetical protein
MALDRAIAYAMSKGDAWPAPTAPVCPSTGAYAAL